MRSRIIQFMFTVAGIGVLSMLAIQPRSATPSDAAAVSHASLTHPMLADDLAGLAMLMVAQSEPALQPPARHSESGETRWRQGRGERMDDHSGDQNNRDVGPWSWPDMINHCLEVANDIDPQMGAQLARKRDKNPEEFERTMRQGQVGRRLLAMAQLKQRDPQLYQIKISEMTQSLLINRAAAQLQEAMQGNDAGKVEALQAQLRNLLQIEVAMSLKSRCEYLARIEEEVRLLREEIDRDARHFREIVDARLQQLMEQPPGAPAAAIFPASSRSPAEPTATPQ